MNENLDIKNLFTKFIDNLSCPEGRLAAFERFEALGLPTRHHEDWKYTSLKSLQNNWHVKGMSKIPKTIISQDFIKIFSYNGVFDLEDIKLALSAYSIEILEAEAFFRNSKLQIQKTDPFWHLNHAFLNRGLFLKVLAKANIEIPIVVEHIVDSENVFANPVILIQMEEDSALNFCETFLSKERTWFNSSFSGFLSPFSRLNFYKFYQNSEISSQVDNNYFEQKDSSTLRMLSLGYGSQLLRSNIHVEILGKQANTDLRGLALLNNKREMDHNIEIHHVAPASTSRQLFKSILNGESHYVFKGNVRIEREAQLTDSDQLNKNLLIGRKARVDTRPQIDVFADDVKATHGSATGQMNPDEKFYLESRCISPGRAKKILCGGYAKEVLASLPINYLHQQAQDFIQRGLDV